MAAKRKRRKKSLHRRYQDYKRWQTRRAKARAKWAKERNRLERERAVARAEFAKERAEHRARVEARRRERKAAAEQRMRDRQQQRTPVVVTARPSQPKHAAQSAPVGLCGEPTEDGSACQRPSAGRGQCGVDHRARKRA